MKRAKGQVWRGASNESVEKWEGEIERESEERKDRC